MKKITTLLLFVIVFACSDVKENKTSNDETLSKVNSKLVTPPKSDGFFIRYRFKKGDIYNYKITTIASNSQELISDTVGNTLANQKVEYIVKLDVEDIDSSKIAKINVFIESIIVASEINGQEVNYDSKYIYGSQERVMFAQYEAIKKKRYTIALTNYGEILKIYNTNSIIKEILSIQQQTGPLTNQQRNELTSNFSNSILRALSEQIFRKFPTEKVSINYSWSESYNSQYALFQIENIASFQLVDLLTAENDSVAIFNAGLSINFVGEHSGSEQGLNFYFYDPVVSGNGAIKFSKTRGLILHSETSSSMEMETDIEGIDQNQSPIKAKRTDITKNINIVELIK